ncbi:MAG: L-lactate permease [Hyphomicrobiaceae bacterium]
MQSAFALLPSVVVLIVVLGLRASGLVAAASAAATAAVLWLAHIFHAPSAEQFIRAVADTSVLTALVAAMIGPGMLFVEATRGRKSPEAIASLVDAIGLPKAQAAILIATGFGIMIESLTGMGVSLLVTMPLLLALFDKRAAIGLGLVGMSLMPWGALSISAHVSSKLSGVPLERLEGWIAAVSGSVAFCLPALALLFVPRRTAGDFAVALLTGAVLVAGIALASRFIGIEIAGVAGGLAVIVMMTVLTRERSGLGSALAAPGLFPYLALLLAVAVQKLAMAPLAAAGLSPSMKTDRVEFALLTSPGVALLLASLISAWAELRPALLATVARRAWRPVAAIALFILSARLLVECGAIEVLARSISGLGRDGAALAIAVLGAIGGFATGSGVTSSALFMPSAAAAGETFGAVPLFAALQNATGGHVAMSALPVAAILLAALPHRQPGDDASVMRTALALAIWHVAVATFAVLILLRIAV